MSGNVLRACSTAVRPSFAVPTTSNAGWPASIATRPSPDDFVIVYDQQLPTTRNR